MNNSTFPELIPRELLFGPPLKSEPQISPDGKTLSYIASVNGSPNLWIKDFHKETDRWITEDKSGIIKMYQWINNKEIIYLRDGDGNGLWHLYKVNIEAAEVKCLTPYKNANVRRIAVNNKVANKILLYMHKENPKTYDLYHLDLISNNLEMIDKNTGNINSWIVSSEFNPVAKIIVNRDGTYSLVIKKASQWKTIFTTHREDVTPIKIIPFTGEEKYIYVKSAVDSDTLRILRIDLKTEEIEIIAEDRFYDIEGELINQDTYNTEAFSVYKERRKWIALDERLKDDFCALSRLDAGDLSICARDDNDEIWIVSFTKDNGPVAYYVFYRKTKEGKLLFYDRPDLINCRLSSMDPISFKSRDGLTIHGYITYPPGREKKNLPVILYVHGGLWWRDYCEYTPVVQWFANRGYVCLQVNYRGSTGYGRKFYNAGNLEWGGKKQNDLIDAVDWVIKEGIGDPHRIAIYGTDYGGYAALFGAAFTPEVFRCAIDIGGPSNLLTYTKALPDEWSIVRERLIKTIGDPEKDEEFLKSRSPLFNAEKIKIPLVIAHGLNNQMVNYKESMQIIKAVKSKGLDVEYMTFNDEGSEFYKEENRLRFYTFTEKFLAKHMSGIYEAGKIYPETIYISQGNIRKDSEIISRILLEGDKKSFEILFEDYKRPIMKILYDKTGDYELATDLMQETFLRAWQYFKTYNPDMKFSSWIFKIANNVVLYYNINEVKASHVLMEEYEEIPVSGWEDMLLDKFYIRFLIENIKEPYKTYIILRFIEELSHDEIAEIMNVTEGQVKINIFRGKKQLIQMAEKDRAGFGFEP